MRLWSSFGIAVQVENRNLTLSNDETVILGLVIWTGWDVVQILRIEAFGNALLINWRVKAFRWMNKPEKITEKQA
jgi:hypothetical protein